MKAYPVSLAFDLHQKGFDVHYMDRNAKRRELVADFLEPNAIWTGKLSARSSHHPEVLIRVNPSSWTEIEQKESLMHGLNRIDIELRE